jgi:Ca2+-transporting ATPase
MTEQIFRRSLGIGLATFLTFKGSLLLGNSLAKARTMALSTLVLAQIANIYDCRSNRSLNQNKYMNSASAVSSALLAGIIYIPSLSGFFGTVPISCFDLPAILAGVGLSKL